MEAARAGERSVQTDRDAAPGGTGRWSRCRPALSRLAVSAGPPGSVGQDHGADGRTVGERTVGPRRVARQAHGSGQGRGAIARPERGPFRPGPTGAGAHREYRARPREPSGWRVLPVASEGRSNWRSAPRGSRHGASGGWGSGATDRSLLRGDPTEVEKGPAHPLPRSQRAHRLGRMLALRKGLGATPFLPQDPDSATSGRISRLPPSDPPVGPVSAGAVAFGNARRGRPADGRTVGGCTVEPWRVARQAHASGEGGGAIVAAACNGRRSACSRRRACTRMERSRARLRSHRLLPLTTCRT